MSNILITGATGFIGSILSRKLSEAGNAITIFTRYPEKADDKFPPTFKKIKWNYHSPGKWEEELNSHDVIIHLAGANLFGRRWDDSYKKKIIESREISTRNIVKAINKNSTSVKTLITASAIGYYGDTDGFPVSENSPPADDFLARVVKIWEEASFKADEKNVRRVNMRTGLILSTKEGYLNRILIPYKLFVGGPLGNRGNFLSWVHIEDVINSYMYAVEKSDLVGAVNVTSPNPVKAGEFASVLGDIMNRPSFFNVPSAVIKFVVGEFGKYVTYSQKVLPDKLLKSGFRFRYPELKTALTDLLNNKK